MPINPNIPNLIYAGRPFETILVATGIDQQCTLSLSIDGQVCRFLLGTDATTAPQGNGQDEHVVTLFPGLPKSVFVWSWGDPQPGSQVTVGRISARC